MDNNSLEKIPNQINQIKRISLRLNAETIRAKNNPLPEFFSENSTKDFLDEFITLLDKKDKTQEENSRLFKMNGMLKAASVEAENLTEFRILLEMCGLDKMKINRFLSHENAHMNVAEQEKENVGLLKYLLIFHKNKEGNIEYSAAVSHTTSLNSSKLDILLSQMRLTQAPDQYGAKMSPGDINTYNRKLQELKAYIEQAKKSKSYSPEIEEKIKKYERMMKEELVFKPHQSVDTNLSKIHDDLLEK